MKFVFVFVPFPPRRGWSIVSNIAERLIIIKTTHENHCWPRRFSGVLGRWVRFEECKNKLLVIKWAIKVKKKKDYLSFIVRVAKSTALIRGDTKQVIFFFLRSEVLKHNNRHVMKIWGKPWYLSVVLWCKI